jgi:hypothetical protein
MPAETAQGEKQLFLYHIAVVYVPISLWPPP